ncbi:MAG TPA: hypothetical protein VEJ46_12855 [Candidatus Acidoferrum sp.]|nr:hypothetical protein [Candidatus Acidoferrum sp.]
MNSAFAEALNTPTWTAVRKEASADRPVTLEQLTQAVADNALLNTEVDQKILARLLQTQEELKATKQIVRDLQQQVAQLVRNLGHVIETTRLDLEVAARKNS